METPGTLTEQNAAGCSYQDLLTHVKSEPESSESESSGSTTTSDDENIGSDVRDVDTSTVQNNIEHGDSTLKSLRCTFDEDTNSSKFLRYGY